MVGLGAGLSQSRFVAKKEADAILEQQKATAAIPIIKEVAPEVRNMIQQARQVPEQREATTAATDDPVLFDKMVAAWAAENHQPSHEASLMLSKATRFIKWLKLDLHERRVADLAEDMRLVTRDEFVRYKEYLLSHSKGPRNGPPKELPATGLGYTSVCRHLHDLRTIFIFASKNRSFENPTDKVTLPSRTKKMMARNKWRSFSCEERFLILHRSPQRGAGHPLVPVGRLGDRCQGQRDCRGFDERHLPDRRRVVHQSPTRQPR